MDEWIFEPEPEEDLPRTSVADFDFDLSTPETLDCLIEGADTNRPALGTNRMSMRAWLAGAKTTFDFSLDKDSDEDESDDDRSRSSEGAVRTVRRVLLASRRAVAHQNDKKVLSLLVS